MASKIKLECIISEGSKEGKADEVMSDIYAEDDLEETKQYTQQVFDDLKKHGDEETKHSLFDSTLGPTMYTQPKPQKMEPSGALPDKEVG